MPQDASTVIFHQQTDERPDHMSKAVSEGNIRVSFSGDGQKRCLFSQNRTFSKLCLYFDFSRSNQPLNGWLDKPHHPSIIDLHPSTTHNTFVNTSLQNGTKTTRYTTSEKSHFEVFQYSATKRCRFFQETSNWIHATTIRTVLFQWEGW